MLNYALMAFAVVFFVVGVLRVVEFKAAGISPLQRKILIPLHIVGSFNFSGAIVLLAIDPSQTHKTLMSVLFFSGVLILFPMHIYLAIKRKILLSKK